MNKQQAIHSFWSSFGLAAYDENTVPENAMTVNNGKYLTYTVSTASFEEPIPLSANLWYRSTSWAEISTKANQIASIIGRGGMLVNFNDGAFWVCRGTPFAQRMADDQDTIRRIYINVMVEFFSAD